MPLFQDTQEALGKLWEQAPEAARYLFPQWRAGARGPQGLRNPNLRTVFARYIEAAGLKPWPKLFDALRQSCATDLAQRYPGYVAAEWLGHDALTAQKHYWRVPQDLVKEAADIQWLDAAQNPTQQPAVMGENAPRTIGADYSQVMPLQGIAAHFGVLLMAEMPPVRLERTTY